MPSSNKQRAASRSRSGGQPRARSRRRDGRCQLGSMLRHLMLAAGTVVTRGAATSSQLWASLLLAGSSEHLLPDRLRSRQDGHHLTDQLGGSTQKECHEDPPSEHWTEIAKKRSRTVRFQPAEVIKVPSWKEELKQMHYSRHDEDVVEHLDLDDTLETVRAALFSRTTLQVVVAVGSMAAYAALDNVVL
eukprot:TRINITY_DN49407_c0_g1_i1.p1 TRINITY_DN49407_c0_g1~~TRINITY_DN49407_c0_g1_i1.p1  ORF type:complete len:189 (-),score=32.42 TRINITY_DN49407_c0_g1_i1:258-824(-)